MSGKIKFNEADLDDDFGGESSDDQAYTDREKYLVKKYKAGQKKSNEDDGVNTNVTNMCVCYVTKVLPLISARFCARLQ